MAPRLWFPMAMLTVGTALLVAAGVAWSAGSGTTGAAGEAPKGGILRLSKAVDFDFVDPALAYYPDSWQIVFATCAKLFNYPDLPGAGGARVIPEVVERFTLSRDGRRYTFELRRTFRFHTGAPVTARSFADAFNRVANPRLQSPATAYMDELVGAGAVLAGKAQTISGVRVLGRYRLQIRLTRPVADLTARLTMPFFCPILPNTPIDPAGIDDPAGSGPYFVAERIVNRRLVLRRNPYYRGGRPANVDQIVVTIGASTEGCLGAIEQNLVDWCGPAGVPTTAFRQLAERYGINRPGGRLFVDPSLSTQFIGFNHSRPAFRGPGQIALKKAINYAIDRPALARAFGYLAGRRTDQMLPPALGRPAGIYPLGGADPATARKWLARARLKPEKLVFYTANHAPGVAVAQVLAFNLKQIGIELDVKYFDRRVLDEKVRNHRSEPFDLDYDGWAVDYADAAAYFRVLLGSGYPYLGGAGVAARVAAADRLAGEERRKAWDELDEDLMRDNPPWAPYLHFTGRTFVSRSFGCFVAHPVYGLDLAAACKK